MTAPVSCIIPAWNEAARIGAVLDAALAHPALAEVIVVDDASTDATAAMAAAQGARVLRQPQNGGKSAAVARGLAAARGDLVLLLDADLVGLTAADLTRLLDPVLTGRADAALSLRANAPRVWQALGLDYISGERVMPRALLAPHLARMAALRRFGLEVWLNDLWIAADLRLAVVRLPVQSPAKAAKHGLAAGLAGDLGMLRDIGRTVGLRRAVAQMLAMRRMAARAGA